MSKYNFGKRLVDAFDGTGSSDPNQGRPAWNGGAKLIGAAIPSGAGGLGTSWDFRIDQKEATGRVTKKVEEKSTTKQTHIFDPFKPWKTAVQLA